MIETLAVKSEIQICGQPHRTVSLEPGCPPRPVPVPGLPSPPCPPLPDPAIGCTHTHAQTHVHARNACGVHTLTDMHTHTYACGCTVTDDTHAHACGCACIDLHTHGRAHAHTCGCAHTGTHTQACWRHSEAGLWGRAALPARGVLASTWPASGPRPSHSWPCRCRRGAVLAAGLRRKT